MDHDRLRHPRGGRSRSRPDPRGPIDLGRSAYGPALTQPGWSNGKRCAGRDQKSHSRGGSVFPENNRAPTHSWGAMMRLAMLILMTLALLLAVAIEAG